jgi:hypothetical protein
LSILITLLTSLALTGQAPTTTDRGPGFKPDTPPPSDSFKPDPEWKVLGKDSKDIWFDPKGKRLVIRARVALQEGTLEHFLCKKNSKEHESILATEAPPMFIQLGLILSGAEPGHPVRFEPKFEPPAGTPIAIEVEWEQAGKWKKVDARDWVKDQATGKPLTRDWVFAGSEVFEDPRTKEKKFAADDGDLITVANFPASILDLPYRSSANDADRGYLANPERVPVRGTPVTMYLQPRANPPRDEPKPKSSPTR